KGNMERTDQLQSDEASPLTSAERRPANNEQHEPPEPHVEQAAAIEEPAILASTIEPTEVEPATSEPISEPMIEPPAPLPPPRPRLAMPQYFLRTDNNQRLRGFLPSDDLQIEVLLPEKEPSRFWMWFTEVRSLVRDFLFAALTALLIVVFVVQ